MKNAAIGTIMATVRQGCVVWILNLSTPVFMLRFQKN